MDESLRNLHEAMVVKDRLRVLAELQAAYWEELAARGFEASFAEQLVLEWSRNAYGMTFRAMPEPDLDAGLDSLLGDAGLDAAPPLGAQPPAPPRTAADPSNVPPGEPWLQLVEEVDLDLELGDLDDRAA